MPTSLDFLNVGPDLVSGPESLAGLAGSIQTEPVATDLLIAPAELARNVEND
jgi:hypothetical protein